MPNFSYKAIAVAAALGVGALAMSEPAEARSRAPAIIAGVVIGGAIAGAIASERRHRRHYYAPKARYYAPQPYYAPRPYYAPPQRYSYRPEPWSPEWYDYCSAKYRSFDPRSGTFQPYRGPRRFCQ